jgi:AAA15 family ATPase/GTPase
MFLEFRVRNFRSFREEAVFSMAASPDMQFADTHTLTTGLDKLPRVVRTAGIFGANASGKSNIIKALQFMQSMVLTSSQVQPDTENNLVPFRLRENANDFPTLMEATFIINGVRHQYGFEFTRKQVLAEWLLVYENAKPQAWFSRTFDEKKKRFTYTYSDYFTGRKSVWEAATRKEVLFLTTAIQLNNEQLKPLYQQLTSELVVFPNGPRIGFDFSAGFIEKDGNAARVAALLAAADTGISSVAIQSQVGKQVQFDFSTNQPKVDDVEMKIPHFGHKVEGRDYLFEMAEESAGTQLFFGLSGPLLDILERGRLLVVDELDSSLHPLLVQRIVDMFQSPETNPNGAQLIFTTHDVSLLDSHKMRRDQVWFTEKDNDQVSHLFPLLDFSPRKGEALEKNYLGGRYGGIPILDPLKGRPITHG